MKRFGALVLRKLGYRVTRAIPPDVSEKERKTIEFVQPFTMTSVERVVAAMRAVEYVARYRVPGDIVECGVWRGGSAMAMARSLIETGDVSRRLFLYDTFEGMTEPSEHDEDGEGRSVSLQRTKHWGYRPASLEEVRGNLSMVSYPNDNVVLVKGPVEETVPGNAPALISVLRLDTDWYASTKHELQHLYPRLARGGVLIIDDYGHYAGARRAVDEYFGEHDLKPYLNRVDYTARLVLKT